MDQSRPSPEHRHKRRTLWAKLWIARIVKLLVIFANLPMPDAARAWFDHALNAMTKIVVYLVLIRAAQLKPPNFNIRNPRQVARSQARHDVRIRRTAGSMRAAIGGRLRRAVRVRGCARKDFQARAEKLLQVLNALEQYAAQVAHRTRNGLTRILELHSGVTLALPILRAAGGLPPHATRREGLHAVAPP